MPCETCHSVLQHEEGADKVGGQDPREHVKLRLVNADLVLLRENAGAANDAAEITGLGDGTPGGFLHRWLRSDIDR